MEAVLEVEQGIEIISENLGKTCQQLALSWKKLD
jgi:hypothetical protein